MEQVTSRQLKRPFEILKQWEQKGGQLIAALGYQALAMRANNPTLANNYFNSSMQALESAAVHAIDIPYKLTHQRSVGKSYKSVEFVTGQVMIPQAPLIWAIAMRNMAPITHDLVVDRVISEPDVVRQAATRFITDLSEHARASKQLVSARDPRDRSAFVHRAELFSTFTTMAVMGLFIRFQTDMLNANDWLAHLAFLEPEALQYDEPMLRRWDISIFNTNFENLVPTHKIHVVPSSRSLHNSFEDDDISVVWVEDDLALPGDSMHHIELDILEDLQTKTHSAHKRTRTRIEKLLEVIDERTYGSIRDQVHILNT